MPLETWVAIAALLSGFLALYSAMRHEFGQIRAELRDLRTELKSDMADLRAEVKGDIKRLDDRVYGLAAGMKPLIEDAQAKR